MKQLNTSETKLIKRSRIAFNPLNPKVHSTDDVKKQLRNFKKNGILGGLVYNERDGKLIAGHKRILAMDLYYKYDGTPDTDYDVKVEVVDFDPKTATEQLTFMSGITDTKADYNLIAKYAPDIDPKDAGISEDDYARIMALSVPPEQPDMPDFADDFIRPRTDLSTDTETNDDIVERHANKPKMTPEQVKGEKRYCDDVASGRHGTQDLYVFLSFENEENKLAFCELMGYKPTNSMLVRGEEVLNMIK